MNKKLLIGTILILAISIFSYSLQDIFENSNKPLNPKAGRIITLTEKMRISDEGEEFYFKWPNYPQIAPNGMIFVKSRDQFLQFDPQGRYLRNLYNKGQGPQEMLYIGNFFTVDNGIILHCSTPSKILWLNYDGTIKKEKTIQGKNLMLNFQLYHAGNYYFILPETAAPEKSEAVLDIRQDLISYPEDGREKTKHAEFTTKQYIKVGQKGGRVFSGITSMITSPLQNRFLFIAHTSEYLVKVFDAESNQIVRSFRRDFKRIKSTDEDRKTGASIDGKMVKKPPQKYKNDIMNLYSVGEKLWVITSNTDKKKGLQVDVFDLNGRYLDMFYLQVPESLIKSSLNKWYTTIRDDYLFAIMSDENDLVYIVKYQFKGLS